MIQFFYKFDIYFRRKFKHVCPHLSLCIHFVQHYKSKYMSEIIITLYCIQLNKEEGRRTELYVIEWQKHKNWSVYRRNSGLGDKIGFLFNLKYYSCPKRRKRIKVFVKIYIRIQIDFDVSFTFLVIVYWWVVCLFL